ncbi:MAG: DNA polymerase III subunit delta' [Burkholderiales bacterium]|nr:DNA polymerase III subunit delta' [Burkholderiales bacterium]
MSDDAPASSSPEPWPAPLPWQRDWLVERLRARDRMHHAHLVTGPAGLGKKTLALHLAQALLCESPRAEGLACGTCAGCGYVSARTHPDLRVLDLWDYDEKGETWEPVAEIVVDRVRAVIDMTQTSAHRAGRRVAVVAPAERMTAEASNALLKTLEEPPAGALLVLTSDQPGRLLPTVASRCLRVAAPRPSVEDSAAWLAERGVVGAEALLAEAGGAPLAALALAESGSRDERDAWYDALSEPRRLAPIALGARIDAGGKDERKARLAAALDAIVAWTADLARVAAGGAPLRLPGRAGALASLAPRVARIDLCRYHRAVLTERARIAHPLQPRLVAEALVSDYRTLFA